MHELAQRVSTLTCRFARSKASSAYPASQCFLPIRHQSNSAYSRATTYQPLRSLQSICRTSSPRKLASTYVRLNSTVASPIQSTAATINDGSIPLDWNRFLEIRKGRRRINVVCSIIGMGSALALSFLVVTTQDVDVLAQKYLGLDALITMGIVVIGTAAAGWLIGPVFGNALFNFKYRALRASILAKEKELFQRIAKHRVDPTKSSYQNPVPDYYGEKIGSVRDYRRWLKDQRAFNLKRTG